MQRCPIFYKVDPCNKTVFPLPPIELIQSLFYERSSEMINPEESCVYSLIETGARRGCKFAGLMDSQESLSWDSRGICENRYSMLREQKIEMLFYLNLKWTL